MRKEHHNTRESHIKTIKYVIKRGPHARYDFKGTLLDFATWLAQKWNKKHPNEKITTKDVGLTREVEEKLRKSHFLPKEKSLTLID